MYMYLFPPRCTAYILQVFVYYKAISKPIISLCLPEPDMDGGSEGAPPFITSLCWKRGSTHLVVANSHGHLWLLHMVP